MKRIYLHIILAAVAALTLAACDKEEAEPKSVRNYPTFSATIEGIETRAFDTSWEPDDQIGISVTNGIVSGGNITGGGASNLLHEHQGNGNFTVKNLDQQIIFTDNNKVHFVAYYPYRAYSTSSSSTAFTAKNPIISNISTADQSNQKNIDFLWAEAEGSKNDPNVEFKFAHMMSKITLIFKNGVGMDVSTISTYKTTGIVHSGGKFYINDNGKCSTTTSASTSSTTITPFKVDLEDDKAITSFIIIPQTLKTADAVKLTISTTTNDTFECNLPFHDTMIAAGKNYQFHIKVSKTKMTVSESSITDWVEDDRGDRWEAS